MAAQVIAAQNNRFSSKAKVKYEKAKVANKGGEGRRQEISIGFGDENGRSVPSALRFEA